MKLSDRQGNIEAIANLWKTHKFTPEQARKSIDSWAFGRMDSGLRLRDMSDWHVWDYATYLDFDLRDRSLDAELPDDYCEKW